MNRREFAAAAGFLIVPRHVLGGRGQVAPSDRLNIATVGLGRQGTAITMDLLARPDVNIVAVCDCNAASKNYAEYGANAMLRDARKLLGSGYEGWGQDLASPGFAQLTPTFRTSLGLGGREPAKRMVEAYYGSRKSGSYKGCGIYRDYRELLAQQKDLDAIYVATPDHWHAPITLAAIAKGKHVLCQKPMTHSIGEAHRVAAAAREKKIVVSLPVNNPSSEDTKLIIAWLADGAVGRVREVHNWSSRPYWPQGVTRPVETQAVPEGLDWDMWLGPAPQRPFNNAYLPFVWRGWYDFGCGSFGDMGCYSFAGIFKILGLTPPTVVEASSSEPLEETFPKASMVHMDFPAVGNRGPVRLSWYDGGLMPRRVAGVHADQARSFQPGGEGVMYVGDKGVLLAGFNGQAPRVYPENSAYQTPKPRPRGAGPQQDRAIDQFVAACKGGPSPATSAEVQAPVTEAFLLGCMAQRLPGERLDWDTASKKVTSSEKANKLVDPAYRHNWV